MSRSGFDARRRRRRIQPAAHRVKRCMETAEIVYSIAAVLVFIASLITITPDA
jgi:hypothetical protein